MTDEKKDELSAFGQGLRTGTVLTIAAILGVGMALGAIAECVRMFRGGCP